MHRNRQLLFSLKVCKNTSYKIMKTAMLVTWIHSLINQFSDNQFLKSEEICCSTENFTMTDIRWKYHCSWGKHVPFFMNFLSKVNHEIWFPRKIIVYFKLYMTRSSKPRIKGLTNLTFPPHIPTVYTIIFILKHVEMSPIHVYIFFENILIISRKLSFFLLFLIASIYSMTAASCK